MSETIHPIIQIILGPEKAKRRNRALKLLRAEQTGIGFFTVIGGEKPHVVSFDEDGLTCDCAVFEGKQQIHCSHIIRVALDLAVHLGFDPEVEFPSEKVSPPFEGKSKNARKRRRIREAKAQLAVA